MNHTNTNTLGNAMNAANSGLSLEHRTLEDQRQRLSQRLYVLRMESKELFDAIVDGLTFKQYQRWDKRPETLSAVTKNSKLVAKANRIAAIWIEVHSLNLLLDDVLRQIDARPSLQLVENKSYDWYELRVMKINEQANTRNRSANQPGLRIVN